MYLLSRRHDPRQQTALEGRQQADESGQYDGVEEDESEDASLAAGAGKQF